MSAEAGRTAEKDASVGHERKRWRLHESLNESDERK